MELLNELTPVDRQVDGTRQAQVVPGRLVGGREDRHGVGDALEGEIGLIDSVVVDRQDRVRIRVGHRVDLLLLERDPVGVGVLERLHPDPATEIGLVREAVEVRILNGRDALARIPAGEDVGPGADHLGGIDLGVLILGAAATSSGWLIRLNSFAKPWTNVASGSTRLRLTLLSA